MKERGILFTGEMVMALLAGRKTMTRRAVKTHDVNVIAPDQMLDRCPYGRAGDRLWVRETWREDYDRRIRFRADAEHPEVHKWKPGIHLKRIHARILLEVTAVRVERAQAISEADAVAEGCIPLRDLWAQGAFASLWVKINGLASWEANPLVYVISFKVLRTEPGPG